MPNGVGLPLPIPGPMGAPDVGALGAPPVPPPELLTRGLSALTGLGATGPSEADMLMEKTRPLVAMIGQIADMIRSNPELAPIAQALFKTLVGTARGASKGSTKVPAMPAGQPMVPTIGGGPMPMAMP